MSSSRLTFLTRSSHARLDHLYGFYWPAITFTAILKVHINEFQNKWNKAYNHRGVYNITALLCMYEKKRKLRKRDKLAKHVDRMPIYESSESYGGELGVAQDGL